MDFLGHALGISIYFTTLTFKYKNRQEASQCDETRFSTIQPSIDVTGIRNERWQ